MLSDDLKADKLPNKDGIDYMEKINYKTEKIVKSTYGLVDLKPLYEVICDLA